MLVKYLNFLHPDQATNIVLHYNLKVRQYNYTTQSKIHSI